MLKDRNSSAIVAVTDIDRARTFYRDTLGLELVADMREAGVLTFRTGQTQLNVYRSEFAGSNRANAVVWAMDGDLVGTVRALQAKGVRFERYDGMDGMDFDDGIHAAGPVKLAWCSDPDGNILHLTEGMSSGLDRQ